MLIGGRFETRKLVGIGTVAAVHLCDDLQDGGQAAVKLLHRSACGHAPLIQRFRSETEILSRLRHPNLVRVFAWGEHEGAPWHASNYAQKGSLADLVLRESVPPAMVLGYARQVTDALAFVHANGIVHRDVKPENILIDEADRAILGDFGIAMVPDARMTRVDAQLGTPAFMAPEQHKNPTEVGPAADLYALGASVFVSLTRQSGMLLLMTHTRTEALAALPPPVAAFVDRSTAFRPEDRYADAVEMGRGIDEALARCKQEGLA